MSTSTALAERAADYFKGKTVSYIVATAPGGGYDTYGRLVAEFMQKHLPGATFVVRNVVGAGTEIGTNMIYGAKPDGLTIGTFNTGLIYSQIVQNEGVRFDLAKMSWIGKAASGGRAILASTTSPVKKFEDLLSIEQPVNFSTGGTSGATYIETKMLKDSLDLQIKILTGYDGNDDQMAMRRGEIPARSDRVRLTTISSGMGMASSLRKLVGRRRMFGSFQRLLPNLEPKLSWLSFSRRAIWRG